jgi:hypothetical protein
VQPEQDDRWYAVRSLFRIAGEPESAYEERITLWRADSPEEAFDRAEAEAVEYAEFIGRPTSRTSGSPTTSLTPRLGTAPRSSPSCGTARFHRTLMSTGSS